MYALQNKVAVLMNDAGSVMVKHLDSYSLVIVNCHKKLECRGCRHKFTCRHIKTVKEAFEDGNPELIEFQEILNDTGTSQVLIPTVVSDSTISFIGLGQHDSYQGNVFIPTKDGICRYCNGIC